MVFFDNCIFKSVGLKPNYHFTFSFSYFFLFSVSFCHRLIFSKWTSYRILGSGAPTFLFAGSIFLFEFFSFFADWSLWSGFPTVGEDVKGPAAQVIIPLNGFRKYFLKTTLFLSTTARKYSVGTKFAFLCIFPYVNIPEKSNPLPATVSILKIVIVIVTL